MLMEFKYGPYIVKQVTERGVQGSLSNPICKIKQIAGNRTMPFAVLCHGVRDLSVQVGSKQC